MGSPPHKLSIDEVLFLNAFGRDVQFHDNYPQSAYLDLERGDLLWLYDDDEDAYSEAGFSPEDNAADRQRVAKSSARYLEILGLDHGDHHEISSSTRTGPTMTTLGSRRGRHTSAQSADGRRRSPMRALSTRTTPSATKP